MNLPSQTPYPWTVISSEVTYEDQWIKLRSDACVTPDGTVIAPFHVLEYPDWVNVVPVLPDGKLLLVREYRHGQGKVLLGLVSGGLADADRELPDPLAAAAKRELLEEVGCSASDLHRVLVSYPNAANHSNSVTTFVASGLDFSHSTCFDPGEDIEVETMGFVQLMDDIIEGRVTMQSMHVAAIFSLARWLEVNEDLGPDLQMLRSALRGD